MGEKELKSQLVCVSKASAANHEALLPSNAAARSDGPEEGAGDRAGSQEAQATE